MHILIRTGHRLLEETESGQLDLVICLRRHCADYPRRLHQTRLASCSFDKDELMKAFLDKEQNVF